MKLDMNLREPMLRRTGSEEITPRRGITDERHE
jgi:hypothetical protein